MRVLFSALLAVFMMISSAPSFADEQNQQRLETRHFVFVHNGKASGLAGRLAEIAEARRHYIRYMVGLTKPEDEKVEVRIAVTEDEMRLMTGASGRVEKWIAGMTFRGRNLIVMSARGNEYFKASDTFVHELAHLYLDRAVGERFVPRWFHEGFAMLASSDDMGARMHSILAATATGSLIPIENLESSFPDTQPAVHLAYAESMFFVRYLQRVSRSSGVRELIDDLRAGMPFDAAFISTWGATPGQMFQKFSDTFSPVDSVLAFLTSATLIWGLVVGVFLFVYFRKKAMNRRRLEMWVLEEQLQQERILRELTGRLDMDSSGNGRPAEAAQEDIN